MRRSRARRRRAPNADHAVASRTRTFDNPRLRKDFAAQDAFLYLEDFLAPEVTAQLVHSARALLDEVNRNYLPGHKQGGSVSRHTIDRLAPFIAELYRSKELIGWLEQLSGDKLQVSPPTTRTRTRCTTTRGRATTSAGTTILRTMMAAVTRCCSA